MKYYKTTITLINWTDAEINTLDQINKNWSIDGQQISKRGEGNT